MWLQWDCNGILKEHTKAEKKEWFKQGIADKARSKLNNMQVEGEVSHSKDLITMEQTIYAQHYWLRMVAPKEQKE